MKLYDIIDQYKKYFQQSALPFIYCNNCGHSFYYPREKCPKCHSSELQVRQSVGKGNVFTYTIIHRKGKEEVCYAIVELDEGFKIYSNISGRAEIGTPVKVFFRDIDGLRIPFFKRSEREIPHPSGVG